MYKKIVCFENACMFTYHKKCNLFNYFYCAINVFFTIVYVVINLPASVSSDRPRAAISSMSSSESLDCNEKRQQSLLQRHNSAPVLVGLESVV